VTLDLGTIVDRFRRPQLGSTAEAAPEAAKIQLLESNSFTAQTRSRRKGLLILPLITLTLYALAVIWHAAGAARRSAPGGSAGC
jgi:hypothetical protein